MFGMDYGLIICEDRKVGKWLKNFHALAKRKAIIVKCSMLFDIFILV